MAFCSKCGTEQTGGANFCVSCGTKMEQVKAPTKTAKAAEPLDQEAPIEPVPPRPKANVFANKKTRNIILGVGVFLVVFAITAALFGPKPLSITKAQAEDSLMRPVDFNYDVSPPDDKYTIMDQSAWVIFSSGSEDCSADGEISTLVKDEGTLLASTDLNGDNTYFNEDIVEFDSAQTPTDIINLIKEGYADPGCDYDSDNIETSFTNLGDSKDKLEVGSANSVYFEENTDWSDYEYDFLDSKSASVIVADGKYLIVLRLAVYSDELSTSQIRATLAEALDKIYQQQ